jgi:Family of unknown function (DUF6236)
MPPSQALYYPWIDIRDEAWLKTSLLYWDTVRTIVPESIEAPYSSETACALQDAGFLLPLRVHSSMEEIEDLTGDALTYLTSSEGAELLVTGAERRRHHIHLEKLPTRLRNLARMHPEKLPHEIRHLLTRLSSPSRRGSDWLEVDDSFALFYMTLLASRLAERVGAGLLTPVPTAERLAVAARLDAQLHELVPWDLDGPYGPWRRWWREREAFGPRRRMPRTLAPGLLSQLAIQRVGVAPDTPVDRLLDFRERHRDELASFRTEIERLTSSVEEDLSAEALRQRVSDLYTNGVEPAIANLKRALEGRRIRWLGEGLLKIAFLSAGSSSMLIAAGLAVPTALLAGAGLSLVVSGTLYNVDKSESLRSNPYAYLLSLEKELA